MSVMMLVRYRNRYWNQVYFEAVSRIAQACDVQGLTLAEAALRWCKHHSKLDAELGDAIIIGASSVPQLQANLVALEQGPLPPSIVDAFEEAWYATKAVCPPYFR
jgi:aflatoxin B1 aldehyde reductase